MNNEDRACDLECTGGKNVHEFVGPVKIIFVDPPEGAYRNKTHSSAFIALANMFMGATIVTVLFHTLELKYLYPMNVHLLLCTVGYQLFIPSGILMLNKYNGASAPLNESHRKLEHLFMQMFGIICALAGTAIVIVLSNIPWEAMNNVHCITGACAGGFVVLASMSGFITFLVGTNGIIGKIFKNVHLFFGLSGFLSSTWCFISGIIRPGFIMTPKDVSHFLVFFCVFYTLIVIFKPLKNIVGCNTK